MTGNDVGSVQTYINVASTAISLYDPFAVESRWMRNVALRLSATTLPVTVQRVARKMDSLGGSAIVLQRRFF